MESEKEDLLQALLDSVRERRMQTSRKIAEGIWRGVIHNGTVIPGLPDRYYADVWDQGYFATLVFETPEPADDMVERLFLWRKRQDGIQGHPPVHGS